MFKTILTLAIFSLILSACGKKPPVKFSDDSDSDAFPTLVDQSAKDKINITKTFKLNEEFKTSYKTFNPDGQGTVEVRARSLKEITTAGKRTPTDGKKLVLAEISVKGNSKNKGLPSTFNQIGEHPSPQFVLIDKSKNESLVETTYYSDGYTEDKKLFELSKITLDHEQWVHTAIVFEIDKNLTPELAFRFTNLDNKTEFYAIQ